eukprot:jgi/Phyca11/507345/fgenesh2_kg.PHYCAscaffold_27_\
MPTYQLAYCEDDDDVDNSSKSNCQHIAVNSFKVHFPRIQRLGAQQHESRDGFHLIGLQDPCIAVVNSDSSMCYERYSSKSQSGEQVAPNSRDSVRRGPRSCRGLQQCSKPC